MLHRPGPKPKKDHRTLLMKMGYSIYDRVRKRIATDHNWRCIYCDAPVYVRPPTEELLATINHRIPLSRGGSWKRYNLCCSCRGCNEHKQNMTEQEFRLYQHLIKPETRKA